MSEPLAPAARISEAPLSEPSLSDAPLSEAPLSSAMRLLQGAIDRFDVEAAGRLGLGRNDWRALRLLVEGGAQAPRDIGAALGLTSGSVTTLIDRLEARGLVRRASDPADRRALIVHARPPAVPCRPRCLRPARRRHGAHRRPARAGTQRCRDEAIAGPCKAGGMGTPGRARLTWGRLCARSKSGVTNPASQIRCMRRGGELAKSAMIGYPPTSQAGLAACQRQR